jgi:hypothetical protein
MPITGTFRLAKKKKRPPELKMEKPCPAFTGQTAGGISTKLHRNDQYHP